MTNLIFVDIWIPWEQLRAQDRLERRTRNCCKGFTVCKGCLAILPTVFGKNLMYTLFVLAKDELNKVYGNGPTSVFVEELQSQGTHKWELIWNCCKVCSSLPCIALPRASALYEIFVELIFFRCETRWEIHLGSQAILPLESRLRFIVTWNICSSDHTKYTV